MVETAIQLSTICARKSDVIFSEIDREFVMMGLKQDRYYGMEGVAASIWSILASPQTVEDIIGKLMDDYDIAEEVCRQETITFLKTLLDNGLIEVRNE